MEATISTSSIFVLGLFLGALFGRLVTFTLMALGFVIFVITKTAVV
jgi:hypothetical protein